MPDMSRYNCKWIVVFDLFPGKIFWPQTYYNFSCWPNPKQKVSNEISITRKLEMRLKCTIDMKYIWPIYNTNHLPIIEKLYTNAL